ncbi:unnamed protein product [Cuscuta europaea]|uniref:Endonuclease/exonuclease/phosphatase domain-containing protein n=1 Tax=Cuscuta europaea TaxID=41803 RepID=A0A9P0ZHK9_CUSEU|nr:unnamed protein product [Cuscuta europaea]
MLRLLGRRPEAAHHPIARMMSNMQGHCGVRDGAKNRRLNARLRFGTWNVGSLTGKSSEVVEVMSRRNISIMCVQETKWVGEKAREINPRGFKLWYSGRDKTRNGVGIIMARDKTERTESTRQQSGALVGQDAPVGRKGANSDYGPESKEPGCPRRPRPRRPCPRRPRPRRPRRPPRIRFYTYSFVQPISGFVFGPIAVQL